MRIFVATISYGEYEDAVIYTKVFSSVDTYITWKESYITDKDILDRYGKEYCVVKEVELDTNETIKTVICEYLRTY